MNILSTPHFNSTSRPQPRFGADKEKGEYLRFDMKGSTKAQTAVLDRFVQATKVTNRQAADALKKQGHPVSSSPFMLYPGNVSGSRPALQFGMQHSKAEKDAQAAAKLAREASETAAARRIADAQRELREAGITQEDLAAAAALMKISRNGQPPDNRPK